MRDLRDLWSLAFAALVIAAFLASVEQQAHIESLQRTLAEMSKSSENLIQVVREYRAAGDKLVAADAQLKIENDKVETEGRKLLRASKALTAADDKLRAINLQLRKELEACR